MLRNEKGQFIKKCGINNTSFKKGHIPSNKGKHLSEDTKKKISLSKKGIPIKNSGQFKKGQISPNKGKKMSLESRKKLSQSCQGRIISEETKRKMSESHQKRFTKEERIIRLESYRKRQIANAKRWRKNNPNYEKTRYEKNPERKLIANKKLLQKLGFPLKISPFHYQWALVNWTKSIRKNYNNICQICGAKSEVSHHLIYKITEPKLSLNTNNGIALCIPCHKETHGWNLVN